jgi:hypothetical protein
VSRSTFSTIEHGWWKDPAVRELSADAALAFVWSFTNSGPSSLTGVTAVSPRKFEGVLRGGDVVPVLDELGQKPLVVYDWDAELLWCVARARFAVTGPKQKIGAQRVMAHFYDEHPESVLLAMYAERYPELCTWERTRVEADAA